MLNSYTSAEPEEPPDPAVIVAFGLYPAHMEVPLPGVATFNAGFTVAEPTVQLLIMLHADAVQLLPPVLRD